MPDTGLNDSGVGHGQLNQSLVRAASRRVVHEKPPRDLFLSKTGFASIVNPASLVLQGGSKIANRIRMITLCDRRWAGPALPRRNGQELRLIRGDVYLTTAWRPRGRVKPLSCA